VERKEEHTSKTCQYQDSKCEYYDDGVCSAKTRYDIFLCYRHGEIESFQREFKKEPEKIYGKKRPW